MSSCSLNLSPKMLFSNLELMIKKLVRPLKITAPGPLPDKQGPNTENESIQQSLGVGILAIVQHAALVN